MKTKCPSVLLDGYKVVYICSCGPVHVRQHHQMIAYLLRHAGHSTLMRYAPCG